MVSYDDCYVGVAVIRATGPSAKDVSLANFLVLY